MTRNAEMVLPEQKERPNMITLKPLPHKPIKEKVIKQRDGDFLVLNPNSEPDAAQKRLYTEVAGQKRTKPPVVRKNVNQQKLADDPYSAQSQSTAVLPAKLATEQTNYRVELANPIKNRKFTSAVAKS